MNYVKNFESPAAHFLAVPFVILLAVVMFSVAFTVGLPWWGYLLALMVGVFCGPYLAHKEYEPIRAAEREYMGNLKSLPLRELAKVVNDPNRPERTKALVRTFLNESHPGWHEQIDLAAPANC
ncbi:MAG: hypothetical protein E6Q69_05005 [Aquipseudomonas alcaligenes]|uniref:Uncharacterized protein n=1 Tax=Aquipseudomonas alcaligenes TaxID=43263 RepID=A0A5C7W7U9_AQUAC|nr:MAG: hypothetical protein E6Q69_05005 [Pseudomonas alcaligenes]